jgi:glycogen operon protein
VFRRSRWFQGRPIHGSGVHDIEWFTPAGTEMSEEDWNTGFVKSLGVFLNGEAIVTPDSRGERITDDSFYILFNSHHEPMSFELPPQEWGLTWVKVLDTSDVLSEAPPEAGELEYLAGGKVEVESRSLVVLRRDQ